MPFRKWKYPFWSLMPKNRVLTFAKWEGGCACAAKIGAPHICYSSSKCHKSVKVKSFSHVWLFATPWTVAYQAPPSMGFSRQGYWRGLPFPSPEDLPNPGIEPGTPILQADALPSESPGKLLYTYNICILFFKLFSSIGDYKILNMVPCATQ